MLRILLILNNKFKYNGHVQLKLLDKIYIPNSSVYNVNIIYRIHYIPRNGRFVITSGDCIYIYIYFKVTKPGMIFSSHILKFKKI